MKAILKQQTSFDATKENDFYFKINSTIKSNRLVVINNKTNEPIYDKTQISEKYFHRLPSSALQNGLTYKAIIYATLSDGTISQASEAILFTCYSAPIFQFANLERDQIVSYSKFECQISCIQAESDSLNFFEITLYDDDNNIIDFSKRIYAANTLSYSLNALEDKKKYYLYATGEMVGGGKVSTDKIPFSVSYNAPYLYPLFKVTNNKYKGVMDIESSLYSIVGKTTKSPVYINENKIDLREDVALFKNGYAITGDTCYVITLDNIKENCLVFEMLDANNTKITIEYLTQKFSSTGETKRYFELKAYNSFSKYVAFSNFLDVPSSNQSLKLYMKREGMYYTLKAEVII